MARLWFVAMLIMSVACDDGESVDNFSMDGLAVGLRGRAPDAASVMQRLTQQDEHEYQTAFEHAD